MIHVVLCGGNGTRLWPLSREAQPKHLIHLLEDQTLLQKCLKGNEPHCQQSLIVCNQDHFHLIQKQLNDCQIIPQKYILEPIARNTAAAVCFAMLACDPNEIALITPADHDIEFSIHYAQAIKQAKQYAEDDLITVFGIAPKHPETGYGYIEVESNFDVKRFHEKPSLETAKNYLLQDHFYWNSGMICAKVSVLLDLIQQYAPEIYAKSKEAYHHASIKDDISPVYKIHYDAMMQIPSTSIDYALLEKTSQLKCVPSHFQWTDMGSFDSLFAFFPKDENDNVVHATQFTSVNARHNLVMGHQRLISLVDVENLAVIDTPDALLISQLGTTQNVKEVVHQLKQINPSVLQTHAEKSCPWGSFTVLESTDMCKVKRLVVLPGKRLSLQKHLHRSEHWVVIAGVAKVTVGTKQYLLHPNQSIFIPLQEIHRIENPGSTDLIIIEVQYGIYTGEDDIIRIEDDFNRVPHQTIENSSLI